MRCVRLAEMTDDQPKRGRPSDYSFQVAIDLRPACRGRNPSRHLVAMPGCPAGQRFSAGSRATRNFATSTRSRTSFGPEDLAEKWWSVAYLRAEAVHSLVARAGIIDRDPFGAGETGTQHIACLVEKVFLAGNQQANDLDCQPHLLLRRGERRDCCGRQALGMATRRYFAVPCWTKFEHTAAADAQLFSMSDEPLMRFCRFYRLEVD